MLYKHVIKEDSPLPTEGTTKSLLSSFCSLFYAYSNYDSPVPILCCLSTLLQAPYNEKENIPSDILELSLAPFEVPQYGA